MVLWWRLQGENRTAESSCRKALREVAGPAIMNVGGLTAGRGPTRCDVCDRKLQQTRCNIRNKTRCGVCHAATLGMEGVTAGLEPKTVTSKENTVVQTCNPAAMIYSVYFMEI
ncbi:hypothetical protein XENOCAPTIV_030686 [Xenoophorus captivus]|uniref:Uncharacterized protein n=1 Tax=Xenoophorus captivus TaxID=1517983 RepID=A0ABV0S4X0_9TELE